MIRGLKDLLIGGTRNKMTKREVAMRLVKAFGLIKAHGLFSESGEQDKMSEAVAMACGELMFDEILNERSKIWEEQE